MWSTCHSHTLCLLHLVPIHNTTTIMCQQSIWHWPPAICFIKNLFQVWNTVWHMHMPSISSICFEYIWNCKGVQFCQCTSWLFVPSKEHNLIYWWYVTNIYNIFRSSNWVKLPECLEEAVECAYPSVNIASVVWFKKANRVRQTNEVTRKLITKMAYSALVTKQKCAQPFSTFYHKFIGASQGSRGMHCCWSCSSFAYFLSW